MRILALDWGTVRIGLAISDPDNQFAFPMNETIKAADAFKEIKKVCDENAVEKIILGIPYSLSGAENESTSKAQIFKDKLTELVAVPIEIVDERFSSVEAGKLLSDTSQKEQRQIKDNIAAQVLLQNYLDKKIKQN